MVQKTFARLYQISLRIVLSVCLRRQGSNQSANEPIVRYLWQTNQYAPAIGRVKPKAFQVNRDDHTVSVFRVHGVSERNIWRLADAFVARKDEKIRARADLTTSDVENVGLRVERKEPPIR